MTTDLTEAEKIEKSSWDEDKLAQLVGLETEFETEGDDSAEETSTQKLGTEENVISQADLFDKNDPHQNATPKTLSKNPFAKLGFVGAGLFVAFGIGGLFLNQMMGMKSTPKPLTNLVSPSPNPRVITKKEENPEGQLKTQLALSKQADELKQIDEESRKKKREGLRPKELKETTAVSTPTPKSTVTPAPVTPQPTYSTYRSTYTPPPTRQPPLPPPVRTVVVPQSQPSPPPPPTPIAAASPLNQAPVVSAQTDPMQRWQQLAQLGSYGQLSSTEIGELSSAEIGELGRVGELGKREREEIGRIGEIGESVRNSSPTPPAPPAPSTPPAPPASPPLESAEEYRVLQGIPLRQALPGMAVPGVMATPVIWSEESSREPQRFVVTLTKPLLDADGNELMPVGQQIVFSTTAVDSHGLVMASAVAVIDSGVERTLPNSALVVQTESGQPLLAQGLFKQQIASANLTLGAVGAVAKVGEILNRPKQSSSQSLSSGSISSTTTSTTSDPNILGAVMEGAGTPILESIRRRNQEAVNRMEEQKNVWLVPVGERVQVLVVQPFEF